MGERKVGVAAGELPAVGPLQRQIGEVDLLSSACAADPSAGGRGRSAALSSGLAR